MIINNFTQFFFKYIFVLMKNIFCKNTYNYNYKIKKYFIYLTSYIKNMIKINFLSKKEGVIFPYYKDIMNIFLIINYINSMKFFYLYKCYINK